MRLTKFSHSCIRLEKDGSVLVFDPGNFSEATEALAGADYLLITHEHPDHFDREPVLAYLDEHPEVQVRAPQKVAEEIRGAVTSPERVQAVEGETSFQLGPFSVQTYGGQHALIHPLLPMVANVAYLVDGELYHPGDSLVVPHGLQVKHLLVPIHAPWNKIGEVIDFVASVRAEHAYPIHEMLLGENGRGMVEGHLTNFGAKYGTEYHGLAAGESVEI